MSKMADEVGAMFKEVFPLEPLVPEYYVNYKGTQLFFDYYAKGLALLFEIQGRQHYHFVKHFHGTVEAFRAQKYRDNLKKEYVEENPSLVIVYFHDDKDKITKELFLKRIYEAQNNG